MCLSHGSKNQLKFTKLTSTNVIDKVMITLDIFICAEGRDRTADPCFFRAMLYQLSYLGNSSILYQLAV